MAESRMCGIEGCGNAVKVKARGLCGMHYQRWVKYGDATFVWEHPRTRRGTCAVDGCDKKIVVRGWCRNHYNKWRYSGDPNGVPRKSPAERFWEKVDVLGPDECWPWAGAEFRYGYGNFNDGKRHVSAHRFSYELAHGVPARYAENGKRLQVLHSCDNPPCCNPAHLFLGTQRDNIRDMDAKGRRVSNPRCGENHERAKLTLQQVRQIRETWKTPGRPSQKVIAGRYGVSKGTVAAIVRGRNWRMEEAQV